MANSALALVIEYCSQSIKQWKWCVLSYWAHRMYLPTLRRTEDVATAAKTTKIVHR